ncbi:MAG: DUF2937 family protein [Parachlamydiaceae bacterium]|nr:DUF2937 family protein [Parachlamydiaceae bacterium]
MPLIRLLNSLLDRLFIIVGAFVGSQVPAFVQQYSQRLSGHVQELEHIIEEIKKIAQFSGKTLDQYIQKFLNSTDPDFVLQGEFMHNVVVRWENLVKAYSNLQGSSMWSRPYVFFRELQYEIGETTFYNFKPSISLSLEGVCYAGLGIIFGYFIYNGLTNCIKWCFSKCTFPKKKQLKLKS